MKKLNAITITATAMMVSATVWADASGHKNSQSETPMDENKDRVVMESQIMQHKYATGDRHMQHHQKSTMGGGNGGTMNPEMMQDRQQHMDNMEQRLANIEALLTQLVEMQKPQ